MNTHDKPQEIEQSSDDSDFGNPRKKPKTDDDRAWLPEPWVPGLLKKSKSTTQIAKAKPSYREQRASLNSLHPGKQFHPKVHDIGNRTTYPCTYVGCPRILITLSGFEYHLLTHTGN